MIGAKTWFQFVHRTVLSAYQLPVLVRRRGKKGWIRFGWLIWAEVRGFWRHKQQAEDWKKGRPLIFPCQPLEMSSAHCNTRRVMCHTGMLCISVFPFLHTLCFLVILEQTLKIDSFTSTGTASLHKFWEIHLVKLSFSWQSKIMAIRAYTDNYWPLRFFMVGFDSKTLMFVHVSPKEEDLCETICSLGFAARAGSVHLDSKESPVTFLPFFIKLHFLCLYRPYLINRQS